MRLTVAARKEVAVKLVESGMSRRQAAKVLEVDQATISRDLQDATESVAKRNTKEAEVQAANVRLKLVEGSTKVRYVLMCGTPG